MNRTRAMLQEAKGIIDIMKPIKEPCVPCGISIFKGTGWTCFLNASMQCLSHCSDISQMVCHQFDGMMSHLVKNTNDNKYHVLACTTLHTLREVLSRYIIVNATYLIDLVCEKAEFQHGQQQDAYECIQVLLEQLSLSLARSKHADPMLSFDKIDPEELVSIGLKSLPGTHSIIDDIFGGQTINVRVCLSCNELYGKIENFRGLTLPFPAVPSEQWDVAINLTDMLTRFTVATRLDDFRCKCSEQNSVTQVKIWTPPRILILMMNRFIYVYDQERGYNGYLKVTIPVRYPEKLDLSDYMGNDAHSSEYKLFSVCCHIGSHSSGHYYTCAKDEHTGKWYVFSDSEHTECSVDDVLHRTGPAYILFYKRTDDTGFVKV